MTMRKRIAALATASVALLALPASPASAATAVAQPDTVGSPASPLSVAVFAPWASDGNGGLVASARPNPYPIEVLGNDTFTDLSTLIVEVVDQPAVGTVTAPDTSNIVGWGNPQFGFVRPVTFSEFTTLRTAGGGTGYERLTPSVADYFTYRLCERADPTDCSAPARVDLNYEVSAFYNVTSKYDWRALAMGSTRNWTVNPLEGIPAVEAASLTVEAGAQWPADAQQAFTADGNGEWTWRLNSTPAADTQWSYEFVLKDSGVVVGRRIYTAQYFPHQSPGLQDDVFSVPVNSTTELPLFTNDDIGTIPAGPGWNTAVNGGISGTTGWLAADGRGTTAGPPGMPGFPSTGAAVTWPVGGGTGGAGVLKTKPIAHTPPWTLAQPGTEQLTSATTLTFDAASRAGTQTFSYRLCTNLPGANNPTIDCSTANVTVHVVAAPEATPDTATVEAGNEVVVDVLDNDKYTDDSATPVTVEVLSVSDGAKARVLSDNRRIGVTAPANIAADAVTLTYRLTDYTGTSTAQVLVNITKPPVVEPPVVDPEPEPDPEPVVPPKARNDHSKVEVGGKVNVDAFDNDTYQGTGELLANGWTVEVGNQDRLVKRGKGWTVTATRGGKMRVQVSPAFKGDEIQFGYRLLDETGETDTATVTVKVTRPVAVPPVIPAGGVFDLDGIHDNGDTTEKAAVVAAPAVAAAAPAVAGGHVLAMLTGWALLALVGAALYRYKRRPA